MPERVQQQIKEFDRKGLYRKVNGILIRNRNILERLNPEGKTSIHRSKLQQKGFRDEYVTIFIPPVPAGFIISVTTRDIRRWGMISMYW